VTELVAEFSASAYLTDTKLSRPTWIPDGDMTPDWEVTGDLTVNLRAERAGTGNGRVYTMTVGCTDASAQRAAKNVTVTVPH
jgi:hypothetical protein